MTSLAKLRKATQDPRYLLAEALRTRAATSAQGGRDGGGSTSNDDKDGDTCRCRRCGVRLAGEDNSLPPESSPSPSSLRSSCSLFSFGAAGVHPFSTLGARLEAAISSLCFGGRGLAFAALRREMLGLETIQRADALKLCRMGIGGVRFRDNGGGGDGGDTDISIGGTGAADVGRVRVDSTSTRSSSSSSSDSDE